jgi:long-chain acyl-CoA synthetase
LSFDRRAADGGLWPVGSADGHALQPDVWRKRSGSIGLPLPDVDCQIVSLEDGETVLPPGEIGELVMRSPQVMKGYHNMPEETAKRCAAAGCIPVISPAWMQMGYFYIVDRKKELIKVSGFQVWPREIEEVIASHPAGASAAWPAFPIRFAAKRPKPGWCCAQGSGRRRRDPRWCEEALVYYKVPVEVEFREALPRTMVGQSCCAASWCGSTMNQKAGLDGPAF